MSVLEFSCNVESGLTMSLQCANTSKLKVMQGCGRQDTSSNVTAFDGTEAGSPASFSPSWAPLCHREGLAGESLLKNNVMASIHWAESKQTKQPVGLALGAVLTCWTPACRCQWCFPRAGFSEVHKPRVCLTPPRVCRRDSGTGPLTPQWSLLSWVSTG